MREPIIKGNPDGSGGGSRRTGSVRRIDRQRRRSVLKGVDDKLRPQRLSEVIGQRAVAERLAISLGGGQETGRTTAPHPVRRTARAGKNDLRHGLA